MKMGIVNLYYLGGFQGDGSGTQFVNVKGTAFRVPQRGEFVQVREYVADAVLQKHPGYFTLNPRVAERSTGTPQVYRGPMVETMTTEEIRAMLAEREALDAIERKEAEKSTPTPTPEPEPVVEVSEPTDEEIKARVDAKMKADREARVSKKSQS